MPKTMLPTDEEMIHKLHTLRDQSINYPSELFEKQRSSYKEAVAALGGLIPTGGLSRLLKKLIPRTTEGVLQAILVSTVVVVTGTTGFLFREQIIDWFSPEVITLPTQTQLFIPTFTPGNILTSTPEPSATSTIIIPTLIEYPADSGHHFGQTRTPKP